MEINIDYKRLGETLALAGLVGKPVNQYTQEQVETLCRACLSSISPKMSGATFTKPYITEEGDLVIPEDADPRYYYWASCGQSLYQTLRELNVSEEIWNRYVNSSEAPF